MFEEQWEVRVRKKKPMWGGWGGEGKSSDFERAGEAEGRKRDVDKDYDNNNKSITWKRRGGNTEPVWKGNLIIRAKSL